MKIREYVKAEHADLVERSRAAALSLARKLGRAAALARKGGELERAAGLFDEARREYADTGLAFARDEELAAEVTRAIKSMSAKASNCRFPREQRPPAKTPAPCCLYCGNRLRRYKRDDAQFYGMPAEWGDYGDNLFCGITHAGLWARWAIGSGTLPLAPRRKQ